MTAIQLAVLEQQVLHHAVRRTVGERYVVQQLGGAEAALGTILRVLGKMPYASMFSAVTGP